MDRCKKGVGVVLTLALLAGLGALRPARAQAEALWFARLTTADGLSHDAVSCISQDALGFMWFGTQNGLNRYDGYTFTVYRHRASDPDSLSDSTVTALYTDSAGTLWVGTVGGLDSLDRAAGRFRHYPAVGELVGALYEDRANTLWVGTHGAGLFQYDRATGAFVQYQNDPANPRSLGDDYVATIYEDDAGTLWVGTWRGLDAFDRATGEFTHYRADPADPHSLSYDRVTAVAADRSGFLWVGTGEDYKAEIGGLNCLDRTAGRFARHFHDPNDSHSLGHNQVTALYQDRAGALWIGTEAGLDVLDGTTPGFLHYVNDPLDPHSLGRGRVTAIFEDRSGIVWIGTRDGGISRYAPAKDRFARYQHNPLDANSLSGPSVSALYKDRAGIVWIGVRGQGLNRLDRAAGQFVHYVHDPNDPGSLGNDHVAAIYEDHEGVLWVGTGVGLDRFDRASGRFTHYVHDPAAARSLCAGGVKVITEDLNGELWVAMEEPGGLGRFSRSDGSFTCYQHDPADPASMPDTYGVRALYPDRSGDPAMGRGPALWLGTYNGLVHLDVDTGTFRSYRHDPADPHSLSHDFVWAIHEDRTGTLWVGTHGGLNRFERAHAQFAVYTTEDGLPNDAIAAILEDGQGFLWLGTIGGGVSRFDPRRETFRNYDLSDGLQSNTVLIGAHHQGADGEIFLGGPDGFNAFYPADIRDNPYLPPIVLTAFRKFDQVVELGADLSEVKEITLSHQDRFFAFEFAALDYTDPARNRYAYRLEGFDQDWIYCGSRRYASYTNLPPGTYTFRVKGANNDGVWNEAGQTVRIVVTPPFWQTWWFTTLACALVAGVSAVVIRGRLRNIAVLRESEERFRMLFESAPLCVLELDVTPPAPRILHANRRSESVLGWPAADLAAVPAAQVLRQPMLERVIESLHAGETTTTELTGVRRDGTDFPARISAARETGRERAILVIEDITAERERRSEEEAIAEERRRIAREIHDGLAQDLAGLRLRVPLWHRLADEAPARLHAELDGLQQLLGEQIREVRRSIFALRPVALDEQGFWPALRAFVAEFGEQNQLHVDLRVSGPTERLPAFLELVLFRIIQESLHNAGRYAQARMVWIELDLQSAAAVTLCVRDDGAGFDPAILPDAARQGHLGLKQMRERVERLQGDFTLNARPGQGTEIRVVLPLA